MKRLTLQQRAALRGQTLVMFAFIILLVTLMVMMTLSFATKAHEKMQLQQVADQAAYSNAVVTARTFNSIAILNRVQIAHMVALAGIQAALSYAALFMGFMTAIEQALTIMNSIALGEWLASFLTCACCFSRWIEGEAALIATLAFESAAKALFTPLDVLTGYESMFYQASAIAMFGFEKTAFGMLRGRLSNQSLTRDIVANASGGKPEWTVPDGPSSINLREMGDILGLGVVAGAAMAAIPYVTNRASVLAAMASRGNWWVTARIGEMGNIQRMLGMLLLPYNILTAIGMPTAVYGMGNAYFGPAIHSGVFPTDNSVWADDHGNGTLYFMRPCILPPLYPLTAVSWAQAGWASVHMWIGNGMPGGGDIGRHTLLNTSYTGVWPPYIDYNFTKVLMENDAYGQPKNFAVVQRDYRKRTRATDPWNLSFRYQFSNSGAGSSYGQGPVSNPNAIILQDGTDVSMQTAISTGITYYHRYNHWSEPPNLFNPFWRAGLSRANIDPKPIDGIGRDWQEDVEDALNNSGVPWAASAVGPLQTVGFSGVQ